MKNVLILTALVVLSGCFDQGTIDVKSDRIDIKVNSDAGGIVSAFADFFLKVEV